MASNLIQIVLWTTLLGAMIFWPAGTLAYPGAWAFLALFAVGGFAVMSWLAAYNPRLLRERLSSPVQRDQKPWDRIFMVLVMIAFAPWLPLMGWDAARTGFTAVPVWLQIAGGIAIAAYIVGVWWIFRENAFAAPVVKIQEGQRVIDTGPYAIVRHPMYAGALLFFVGVPLLLGSWLGLAFVPLFVFAFAWRTVGEEAVLRAELAGYDAYAQRVRYRFIPFIW